MADNELDEVLEKLRFEEALENGSTVETVPKKKYNSYEDFILLQDLENLEEKYSNALDDIYSSLIPTPIIRLDSSLDSPTSDELTPSYLDAMVRQNFIIMRQLEEISKKINK